MASKEDTPMTLHRFACSCVDIAGIWGQICINLTLRRSLDVLAYGRRLIAFAEATAGPSTDHKRLLGIDTERVAIRCARGLDRVGTGHSGNVGHRSQRRPWRALRSPAAI
jgi:hypothetical protein